MGITINIYRFYEQFKKEYDFLYEHNDRVAGFREAVNEFDKFLKDQRDFVGEFISLRGDFITSDREAAAFMFALKELTNIDD